MGRYAESASSLIPRMPGAALAAHNRTRYASAGQTDGQVMPLVSQNRS